ncbi:hypothetical protein MWU75_00975 [Ornithinimicrobium sp. F0845]|uniref:hypothetical protein n=1 Tax=Ornithinimicrobium sp. F0845 TaxID=2926412 RepID=UPI001FF2AC91|nr:hypothetical protein [Ornithinimicrobium sp. F0845]MCK0110716.1 hypothetical protein [Ornithinimicrobium sp. F0845]
MTRKILTRRAGGVLAATGLVLALAACADDQPQPSAGLPAESTAEGEADGGEAATSEETQGAGEAETSEEAAETAEGTAETSEEAAETAEGTAETSEAPETVAAADVEAARAGLAAYLEANMPATPQTSTNIPGCPVIERAALEEALAGAGYPGTSLEGWGTEIEWDEYEGVGEDVIGIVCGGDSDGSPNDSDFGVAAGIIAVDLKGTGAVPEDILGDTELVPGPEGLGGEIASLCQDDTFCLAAWISDDLVLGTVLNTDGASAESARAMLDATLPELLETLAAN